MSEPAEEKKNQIQEVWVTENGKRYRAYRGRNPEHVQWKLDAHSFHAPEIITFPEEKK